MKYLDLLYALEILSRYYPKYYSQDLFQLADDVLKWFNNELPEDSSTLIYLKSCFASPSDALKVIWKEIQLLAGPLGNLN
jgi:hypothetical protein